MMLTHASLSQAIKYLSKLIDFEPDNDRNYYAVGLHPDGDGAGGPSIASLGLVATHDLISDPARIGTSTSTRWRSAT